MKLPVFKTLLAAAIAAVVALPGASLAGSETDKRIAALYEAAKKEGEVIFYTTGRKAYNKKFSKFWKKKFPDVNLKILRKNSGKLIQTFAAELAAGKPRPDVISISAPYMAQIWLDKGLYAPYKPANFDKIDARFKDPDGHWLSRTVFLLLGAYNTNLIKEKSQLPKTFTDLLAPKWKDKLLSAHPQTAGSSRTFYATVVRNKIAGGWEFLEKLGKQNLFYTRGNSSAARMVVAGERPLAVAISSHNIVVAIDKGQAINWFTYEDGAIINHSPMGILKSATHPNAAKLLVEWTYSIEGQNQLARWGRQWGSVPGAEAPKGMPPLKSFKLVNPNLKFMIKGGNEFLEKFGDAMGKRG
jgi:iron(III) transport system substrate-binding protein